MITIIDYGLGNLGSIKNMIKKIGYASVISSDPIEIANASKLILPGVGAFDRGMKNLKERNLIEPLNQKVLEQKTPILGICLGMQLMTNSSEEGSAPGLKWIDADVKKFRFENELEHLQIPHMGWNYVNPGKSSKLLKETDEKSRYYFVHTYHVVSNLPAQNLLECNYGYPFVAAFEKENILGVQFHPEKSHKFGLRLLTNFIKNY